MTTIATDGREIAADGLITGNGLAHMTDCPKLFLLRDGSIAGFSGSVYVYGEAVEFLDGDRTEIDLGDNFEALILRPDGRCECMDGKGRRYWQSVPCVTGSGSPVALGAMAAGASPKEAVEIASRYDQATGGVVTAMRITPAARAVA